jgi:2-amino-4-hydroxy-6-hydroxymethyldihydropteridine diphosphokinase
VTRHLGFGRELYFIRRFPGRFPTRTKRHTALIGIGGNVGNVPRRFKQLLNYLREFPAIDVAATSAILKNPPFGYTDQPDFYNALFLIRTDLSPMRLLRCLQQIEKRFGRVRSFPNAPRTLDLDIIFFESKKMYNKTLTIPHPHWNERDSVLIPMIYLQV